MNSKEAIRQEISHYMPFEEFVRIQNRLLELRLEEEKKLKALAALQNAYVSANSDMERDLVKETVGKIRELSKATRQEIRSLKEELLRHLPWDQAKELFDRLQKI